LGAKGFTHAIEREKGGNELSTSKASRLIALIGANYFYIKYRFIKI
jgi:hypothetical protein